MNTSAAIQVLPETEEGEMLHVVDSVIRFIEKSGLNYQVGAFETVIEGDYDRVMEVIKLCQTEAVRAGAKSVKAYVKINYNPSHGVLTIDEKTAKYRKQGV